MNREDETEQGKGKEKILENQVRKIATAKKNAKSLCILSLLVLLSIWCWEQKCSRSIRTSDLKVEGVGVGVSPSKPPFIFHFSTGTQKKRV